MPDIQQLWRPHNQICWRCLSTNWSTSDIKIDHIRSCTATCK